MGAMELSNNGKLVIIFIGSVLYTFSVLCNLALLLVIAVNKSLHEPMYMLLFHLIINDLIGISAMIPKVLSEIMSEYRYTSFLACLGQAFCIHIYGGATLFILSVMALDRYVAICYPLRYHAILTKGLVGNLIACVWLADFTLITALLGLMLRFPFCKTVLVNVYCDNVSLLRATCATDTSVNNIYGLFISGVYHDSDLAQVN
ncbi:olfactory receptor 4D2-like [Osmerus mordax]|uniref:olfactory receptor 4D2-like n=1 Tax=Osmerus mordax TaxID=8014 RepID=UPI00350EAA61